MKIHVLMWETLNNFEIKKEGAQLQYLINIMCKFGWILLSSLGGVVDKRWVTPSDPENSYFDAGNHKKLKKNMITSAQLHVWEKIV